MPMALKNIQECPSVHSIIEDVSHGVKADLGTHSVLRSLRSSTLKEFSNAGTAATNTIRFGVVAMLPKLEHTQHSTFAKLVAALARHKPLRRRVEMLAREPAAASIARASNTACTAIHQYASP